MKLYTQPLASSPSAPRLILLCGLPALLLLGSCGLGETATSGAAAGAAAAQEARQAKTTEEHVKEQLDAAARAAEAQRQAAEQQSQ